MNVLQQCETLMRQRKGDWWQELCAIIPELTALSETPQPREHHAEGDVAQHTRMAIGHCPPDCPSPLLWIALLHDIGKAETTVTHDDNRITAHGHAKLGAERAETILADLGMPLEQREQITWTIRHHVFHHSWQLRTPADLSKRQRSVMLHPWFPMLLEFLRIDSLASESTQGNMGHYFFYRDLLASMHK